MKLATAIIVDDERPARRELAYLLKVFPEIEIIGESDDISGAVDLIQKGKPDIVFLDIQLAGENGFELLERANGNFKVIFITAYDEYAIRAFEVNAADYLLKPVDPARLELSVRRIFGESELPVPKTSGFKYNDLLYVKQSNNTAKFIKLDSVVAIHPVGNYSKLVTKDGNGYLVLKTLKQWEEELPEKHFIRIHRSGIINLEFINKFEKYSGNSYRIHMLSIKEPLEVSRSSASKLKNLRRQK